MAHTSACPADDLAVQSQVEAYPATGCSNPVQEGGLRWSMNQKCSVSHARLVGFELDSLVVLKSGIASSAGCQSQIERASVRGEHPA